MRLPSALNMLMLARSSSVTVTMTLGILALANASSRCPPPPRGEERTSGDLVSLLQLPLHHEGSARKRRPDNAVADGSFAAVNSSVPEPPYPLALRKDPKFQASEYTAELEKAAPDTPQNYDAYIRLGGRRASAKWQSSRTASESLCVQGRLVPQFYLLGAPKCGTTSMADDLRAAGVASNAEPNKEMHFFDHWARQHNNLCSVTDFPAMREAWLSMHGPCSTEEFRLLGDYTPDNARMTMPPPGTHTNGVVSGFFPSVDNPNPFQSVDTGKACLNKILPQLYPGLTSRLTFVMMVREPLSRVLSAYYFRMELLLSGTVAEGQFQAYMDLALSAMGQGIYDSFIWPTMYARQLENYLETFEEEQFLVAPYLHYFNNKCLLFQTLEARLGVTLECEETEAATEHNTNEHPPLEEVLSNSSRNAFNSAMQPEVDRLVAVLANTSSRGLLLAAYNGTLGSEEEIRDYLVDGWR